MKFKVGDIITHKVDKMSNSLLNSNEFIFEVIEILESTYKIRNIESRGIEHSIFEIGGTYTDSTFKLETAYHREKRLKKLLE